MYFDEFILRLQMPELPSFILFAGDAEDVSAEGQRRLRREFLAKNPSGTVRVFDASEHGLPEVLDDARASSLFAANQLLILRRAEKRLGGRQADAAVEALAEYLADPNPLTVLAVVIKGARKDSKLAGLASRNGWLVSCSGLPDWKAVGWVKSQAPEAGLTLTDEAAQALLHKVGNDMGLIRTTLEHLAVALFPATQAGARDVEDLPVPGAEPEIFAFLDCVATRRSRVALHWLAEVKRADSSAAEEGVFSMLHARLRDLLFLAVLQAQGVSEAEAPKQAAMHPFRLKMLWQQARGLKVAELEKAMTAMMRLQAGQVAGRLTKVTALGALERWLLGWGKGASKAHAR